MFRYFGPLEPDKTVYEGEWEIIFKCYKEGCRYVRKRKGEVVKYVVGIMRRITLLPKLYGGESYFLYLSFDRELTLDAEAEVEITLGVPIAVSVEAEREIEIINTDGSSYVATKTSEIDVIPFSRVRYAIYGTLRKGILTRYYKTSLGSWLFLSEAPLKVRILNMTDEAKVLRRLLLPTLLPKVYYVPGTSYVWLSPVEVKLEGKIALVERSDAEPRKKEYVPVEGSGRARRWVAVYGL